MNGFGIFLFMVTVYGIIGVISFLVDRFNLYKPATIIITVGVILGILFFTPITDKVEAYDLVEARPCGSGNYYVGYQTEDGSTIIEILPQEKVEISSTSGKEECKIVTRLGRIHRIEVTEN